MSRFWFKFYIWCWIFILWEYMEEKFRSYDRSKIWTRNRVGSKFPRS